ncbi:ATP-binding protein [Actinoplanes sp. NPDC023801]|uniref:sensor histidine kinase n=1 Tax=Actinoplanes sp. NPDC023801 TaxID=3154595 RepID=UPI0033CED789
MDARWRIALAGLGGALLIVVAASPRDPFGPMPLISTPGRPEFHSFGWVMAAAPVAATVAALLLVRWWPYLLATAGLLVTPLVVQEITALVFPRVVYLAVTVAPYPLAVAGVLGCAQSLLLRHRPGPGSAVAGLAAGSVLFAAALRGATWLMPVESLPVWRVVLLLAGAAALVPALSELRYGDPEAVAPVGEPWWGWRRLRLILTAGAAVFLEIPLALLHTERLAELLDVNGSALQRHPGAATAVVGVAGLGAAAVLAAVAGLWALAGALTAGAVLVGVSAPMLLAVSVLGFHGPARWIGALTGVAIGAVVAATRWRVAGGVVLSAGAAVAIYIAWSATTGNPQKLVDQGSVVPGMVLLVLVTAAGTAVFGAIAPSLAPRGAVPAVLGPLAAVLMDGGLRTVQVAYQDRPGEYSGLLLPAQNITTSAQVLLGVAAGVAGIGVAHYLAERWAERKRAEQIRREAAEAERERLARPIHDGVLQVLAMVKRGEAGSELAALAGEQEQALRNLLRGGGSLTRTESEDVDLTAALALPGVQLSAPATAVVLPGRTGGELVAAVLAALDNVRRHAGDGARVWILLEDEGDGVRVTVRDDGAGFTPGRLAEAENAGRLGVAQSMRGRINDLGGTTTIHSAPGQGTEVEFWVPRR